MHFDQALEDALDACLDFLLLQDAEALARVRGTLAVSTKSITSAMKSPEVDELLRVFSQHATILQAGAEEDGLPSVRMLAKALLRARRTSRENI